jgi:hypothetical protein
VAKGMSLVKIPVGGDQAIPLTVEPFQTAIGIDIDCPNKKVYWSDVGMRAIKMGNFNGSERVPFLEDGMNGDQTLIDLSSIPVKNVQGDEQELKESFYSCFCRYRFS